MRKRTTIIYLVLAALLSNCAVVTVVNKTKEFKTWSIHLDKVKSTGIIYGNRAYYPQEKDSRFIQVTNKSDKPMEYTLNGIKLKNNETVKNGIHTETGYFSTSGRETFKPNKPRSVTLYFEFPKNQDPTAIELPELGDFEVKLVKK